MKNPTLPLLVAALIALALVAGCGGGPVNHGVANAVKRALPDAVGPADSWDVDVTGNPGTIIQGRVPAVLIHGVNVRMSPQLAMETLDITATDVRVDIRKRELKSIDSLTFVGTMTQDQVDQYLAATASSSKRPSGFAVKIGDADMGVAFKEKLSFVTIPIEVAGHLAVSSAGPDKVDFVPSKMSVASLNIPRQIVDIAVKQINPTIDLSEISIPVSLKNIHIANHCIVFAGSAQIPKSAFEIAKRQTADAR